VSVPNSDVVGGLVALAYQMPAIVPVYAEDGNWGGPVNGLGDARNPYALASLNQDDKRKTTRIFGNVYGEAELFKDLALRTDFGLDYSLFGFKDINPRYQMGILSNAVTSLSQNNAVQVNWVWNNTLRYKKSFGKSNISVLAGSEAIRNTFEESRAGRTDFLIDDPAYLYLNSGQGQQTNSGIGYRWSLFSYFGRVDYNFADRYLVSGSLRRDGSSRFSSSNRFAVFPAFSVGWRLSNENFFPKNENAINDLKLRFSWGQSGNQDIGNYASYTTFSTNSNYTNYDLNGTNNTVLTGFSLNQFGNPDVRWETTTQTNIGLDVKLLKNSVSLSFDYFVKTTDDILVQKQTLAVEGQALPPFVNAGKIENKGFETQINYFSKQYGDFSFDVGVNFSAIRNKVVSLGDEIDFLTGTVSNNTTRNQTLSRTQSGLPIGQFYGHVTEGIFQNEAEVDAHATQPGKAVGRLKFKDLNNDGVIDNDDRQVIGNPLPDFMYGINIAARYKKFDLSLFFQGVEGNELYNLMRYNTDFFYDPFNKSARTLNAWSPENTNASVPAVSTVNTNNELRPSTYFIEDGSFLRLKNLQIGYNFPFEKFGIEKLRLYFQAQNLLTFTKYEGLDPEVSLRNFDSSNRNLDIGIDRGIYPNTRTLLLGLNVQF
jgi:TonB-linked SusC/RagA family outer membrane protein